MLYASELRNPIQNYAWGSRTALAAFLGSAGASEEPEAELWMGAHPNAPSRVEQAGAWRSLCDVIAEDPLGALGSGPLHRFGAELPFLFKVLAVAQPLSLQAHPSRLQAQEGWDREERSGLSPRDPKRNYRDRNHKPEMVCALTRFSALKGFRPVDGILGDLARLRLDSLAGERERLAAAPDASGLGAFLRALLELDATRRGTLLAEVQEERARAAADADAKLRWAGRLADAYPGDVGALAPLLLHLVVLEPGQALFLPAGELHCYLDGLALELMANSDNVLRGGLTPKHVDTEELVRVLQFSPSPVEVLEPEPRGEAELCYPERAEEFALSRIDVRGGAPHRLSPEGPEILLCVGGRVELGVERAAHLTLERGRSAFVAARTEAYQLSGEGLVYRARVPRAEA